jgi:hypothetical protein
MIVRSSPLELLDIILRWVFRNDGDLTADTCLENHYIRVLWS